MKIKWITIELDSEDMAFISGVATAIPAFILGYVIGVVFF